MKNYLSIIAILLAITFITVPNSSYANEEDSMKQEMYQMESSNEDCRMQAGDDEEAYNECVMNNDHASQDTNETETESEMSEEEHSEE